MKSIFKFAAIAAIAAAFACSCQDQTGPEPGPDTPSSEYTQDLQFTLELKEVEADQVKVTVEHNGTEKDTWYGFATTETDIEKAITEAIEEGNAKLLKRTKYTVSIKNLEPETEYTFIAVGVTADGKTYGEPATLEFTTKKGDITSLEESDEWEIAYEGREDGKEIFSINCAENSYYRFDVVEEYYIYDQETDKLYLQEYMMSLVQEYQEYVDEGATLDQFLQYGFMQQGPGALASDRMASGTYYAIAIGYDENVEPTGTYSAIKFNIIPEKPTAEYNKWIGTYDVTSANGITYTITLAEYDPNYMYAVFGWEIGDFLEEDKDGDGKADGLNFANAFEDYEPAFPIYFNDGNLEFYEYYITQLTLDKYTPYFGLYAWALYEGELSFFPTGGSIIATASSTDNGATGTINGVELELEDGSTIATSAMSYSAYDSENGYYWQWNTPMEFPIEMVKKTTTPSASLMSAPMPKNIHKSLKPNKDFKVLKSNNATKMVVR